MSELNKVVAHFNSGKLVKGTTQDFFPNRPTFHMQPTGEATVAVRCKDLKALFFETREKAKQDLDGIASYHKAIRLRRLDDMINTAMERGNLVVAAQLLEQAAKESGGAYTNKHQLEHTGKDGKDLPAAPAAQVTIFQLPDNGRG